jgi:serine/threonine protein kinase
MIFFFFFFLFPLLSLQFAIKIIDWSLVDDLDDQTECIEREIKIMKLLDHPNIVKLYDLISHRDDKQTFLVQEYISRGELFDYIVANGRIREPGERRHGNKPARKTFFFSLTFPNTP